MYNMLLTLICNDQKFSSINDFIILVTQGIFINKDLVHKYL